MKIQWIQDFLSLVDTGSFSKSADIRATTQPAFSRRIKALEEWLSAPLFDRSESPVCLTDAGGKFFPLRLLTHCPPIFPCWLNKIEEILDMVITRLEPEQMDKGEQLWHHVSQNALDKRLDCA